MKKRNFLLAITIGFLVSCGSSSVISSSSIMSSSVSTRPIATSIDAATIPTELKNFTFVDNGDETYSISRYSYKNGSTTRVVIPETYNEKPVIGINKSAFVFAGGIETIVISKNITSISKEAFLSCLTLKEIEVNSENSVYSSNNGILFNKDMTTLVYSPEALTNISIPSSVRKIGDYGFYRSTAKEIILNEGIVEIGEKAFSFARQLTSISIPNSVLTIGQKIFENASELEEINLGTGISELPTHAIRQCSSLKKVIIPGNVRILMNQSITENDYLKEIVINEGVETLDQGAIIRNASLISVKLPQSLRTIGYQAFYYNDSIQELVIPEGVTEIGYGAFSYCQRLKKLTIPSTVKTIDESIIAYNRLMTDIIVSSDNPYFKSIDNVLYSGDGKRLLAYAANRPGYSYEVLDSVEIIDDECFSYAIRLGYQGDETNIGKLVLPVSLKKIGINCFSNALQLSSINYKGTVEQWNSIVKSELLDGTLCYYSDGSSLTSIQCSDDIINL